MKIGGIKKEVFNFFLEAFNRMTNLRFSVNLINHFSKIININKNLHVISILRSKFPFNNILRALRGVAPYGNVAPMNETSRILKMLITNKNPENYFY